MTFDPSVKNKLCGRPKTKSKVRFNVCEMSLAYQEGVHISHHLSHIKKNNILVLLKYCSRYLFFSHNEIQNVIANKTVTEWLEKLLSSDIPASAVNSVESALADEQTIANDMVVNIEHSEAGTLKMLGVPYKFSDTPAQIDKAPPLLGEDNNDVLSSLGYDEEYIKDLHTKNVI